METGVAGATHLTYWTEPFTPDLSHSNPLHSIPLNWTLHFTPGVIREVVRKVYMLRTQSVWEKIAIEFRTLSLKRVLVHFFSCFPTYVHFRLIPHFSHFPRLNIYQISDKKLLFAEDVSGFTFLSFFLAVQTRV